MLTPLLVPDITIHINKGDTDMTKANKPAIYYADFEGVTFEKKSVREINFVVFTRHINPDGTASEWKRASGRAANASLAPRQNIPIGMFWSCSG